MNHEAIKEDIQRASNGLRESLEKRTEELCRQVDEQHVVEENLEENDKPARNDVFFSYDEDLNVMCRKFGMLSPSTLSPKKCTASGQGISRATVGLATYLEVALFNNDNSQCNADVPISVELQSANSKKTSLGIREERNGNKISYYYVPKESGLCQLSVLVRDNHVRGSPFNVEVINQFPVQFRLKGTISGLWRPYGLAVSPTGQLAVVENSGNSTISVYSANLEKLTSFGSYGSNTGQSNKPQGVCFGNEGHILVVDGDNHRLHKFSPDGSLVSTAGSRGKGKLQFSSPVGVACSEAGLVYVADRFNDRVQILNLGYISEFGHSGSGSGNFDRPWDVGVDSKGCVYVTDAGHKCLKKFDSLGRFISKFSCFEREDQFECPTMLAIGNDYIFVTDKVTNKLSIFDEFGRFHGIFGYQGGHWKDPGRFSKPIGVAIGTKGQLYVSEVDNNRVQMFH